MQWYCQAKLFNAIVARLFNSPKHDYLTVNDTIFQLSVLQLFNSYWYHCSTVAGLIFHQLMARFLNSQCNFAFYCSGTILQYDIHCQGIVSCIKNTTLDPIVDSRETSPPLPKITPRKVAPGKLSPRKITSCITKRLKERLA